ncbi:MAG: PDZ domain-containing protein [Planctomycetia bacterium]|nr:PDZ domain-containing protein [Planctomycetia bacterium]
MTPPRPDPVRSTNLRTPLLALALVMVLTLLVWPSFMGRIQYARTREELAAIRDAAAGAELAPVGKLFTSLARLVGPAVVNVSSSRPVVVEADEVVALRGRRSQLADAESSGSGVIVEPDGVIVTNYHVIARSESIEVRLADGRRFKAEMLGADAATDLAVLRIPASDLPTVAWGDSDRLEVGEMVWAIGNPFGLDRTVTYGIISATGRRGVLDDPRQEFLQTDAAVNPGSSGGPLVNVHAEIVGINTAIVGADFQGIAFAIPANTAREVCRAILDRGPVERGFLGVEAGDAPDGMAGGALLVQVDARSPAAQAGLKRGDVVIRFDGKPVIDHQTLFLLAARAPIGNELAVDVLRDGAPLRLRVRVGRRPAEKRR